MIRLEGASVDVPDPATGPRARRRILGPISLELTERRIAFIGANGSGKSTLLRLLNGLLVPDAGRVLVGELDTRREGRRIRRQVGFVFTDPLAQLVMATPADDIELSLRATVPDRTERRATAHRLLAQRGLEHLADSSVYDLSGGERQLVALTSVLACAPAIVVADEPTTLLDLRNRNRIRTALAGLEQQLLVATHDLGMAAEADRVIVIDDGVVVADGEPGAAIAAYRELMA
ncbi:MAG: ABC transporter ATP-binding protein [Propionibacteriaceae bacterium]|nr:ABC transporter ATP-binding protein [Propionibacteriaceae bacterium]